MGSEFEVDMYFDDEVNDEEMDKGPIGQSELVPEGYYHGEVIEVVMKDTFMIIESRVKASSVKGVRPDTVFAFSLFFRDEKWARMKMSKFAKATGLLGEAKSGTQAKVDFSLTVGRHFVIQLENDGQYNNVHYANIWSVKDPLARKKVAVNDSAIGDDPFKPIESPKQTTEQESKSFF